MIRRMSGELIVSFSKLDGGNEVVSIQTITFNTIDNMLLAFYKIWKQARRQAFVDFDVLRCCVDNMCFRDKHSVEWISSVRDVCDKRAGREVNVEHVHGIKMIIYQFVRDMDNMEQDNKEQK